MKQRVRATLKLENGMQFHGWSFGYEGPCDGEVVFSTAMAGYTESLTDPSYSGQILCITFPIVGCYGVPEEGNDGNGISRNFESDRIHAKGLVISDYSENFSHWSAVKSLGDWMKEQKIPGIYGIDTRELAKVLRDKGSMLGIIVTEGQTKDFPVADPDKENQVEKVSCKEVVRYGQGDKKVVLLDCGTTHNIIRYFLGKGVEVVRVPYDYDFNTLEYDGLLISNGPGNPEFCGEAVVNIRKAMEAEKPVFGLCMGNLLLGLAAGGKVVKLKSGHRSHNQPVRMTGSNKCCITTQNHSYTIDSESLGADWETSFVNMNDGSCEGIRHRSKPFSAVHFYPEAANGSTDMEPLFSEFLNRL